MTTKTRPDFWFRVSFCGGIAVIMLVVGGTFFLTPSVAPASTVATPSATPTVTPQAIPSETASSPAPVQTQTPASSPAARADLCTTATISAPTIGLEAEVGEYTYEDAALAGGVNPPVIDQAVWYSGTYRQNGINSTMSNGAEDTVFIYGHSYLDDNQVAVFDHIGELSAGETVTVRACDEVIILEVLEVFDINKSDFSEDPRVFTPEPIPGHWVFATCDKDGPRSADGHTTLNTVVTFQAVPAP